MKTPWYATVQGRIIFVVPEPDDMMISVMSNVIIKAHEQGSLTCRQLTNPDFGWIRVTLS